MPKNPPACVDCRHCHNDWGLSCRHPFLYEWDVIYGKMPSKPFEQRSVKGMCRPEGFFFTPKPTTMERLCSFFGFRKATK